MVPWYLPDVWGWELRVGLDSGAREGRDSGSRLCGLDEDGGIMCIDGGVGIVGKNIMLVEKQRTRLKLGRYSAGLQPTPTHLSLHAAEKRDARLSGLQSDLIFHLVAQLMIVALLLPFDLNSFIGT